MDYYLSIGPILEVLQYEDNPVERVKQASSTSPFFKNDFNQISNLWLLLWWLNHKEQILHFDLSFSARSDTLIDFIFDKYLIFHHCLILEIFKFCLKPIFPTLLAYQRIRHNNNNACNSLQFWLNSITPSNYQLNGNLLELNIIVIYYCQYLTSNKDKIENDDKINSMKRSCLHIRKWLIFK